jgi:exopolysaccharide biosynthesis polyprenyl glycosylphosphotransferase
MEQLVPAQPATPRAEELPTLVADAPRVVPRSGPTRSVRAWMLVPPTDLVMLSLPIVWSANNWRAIGVCAVLTVLLTSGRAYRARLHLSVLDELPWLFSRFAVAVALVATVTALRREQEAVTAFLVVSIASFGLLVLGRAVTTQLILWARRRQLVSHNTLIVGEGAVAADVALILANYRQYGLHVLGYASDSASEAMDAVAPRLGTAAELDRVVTENRVTAVIVADGDFVEEDLLEIVRRGLSRSCELLVVPRLHHLNTLSGMPDHVGSIPVMRISSPNLQGPVWAVKRGFDIVTSVVSLLVLAPLLAVCALAVRLEGGPGIIFRQQRVGRDGKVFDCLKFRSMRPEGGMAGTESQTRWSIAQDDRVGPVGRVLRKTSLDELPQLWNILRGEMTLVGPRPERPYFVSRFSAEIPRYDHRHRVRAGLTGFAQVSGLRGDTSIIDRARFDNYYIENWSLWLDAKVILRTVGEVLFARGR